MGAKGLGLGVTDWAFGCLGFRGLKAASFWVQASKQSPKTVLTIQSMLTFKWPVMTTLFHTVLYNLQARGSVVAVLRAAS